MPETNLRERVAAQLCHDSGRRYWAENPEMIPEKYWEQADEIIESIREGMAEAWDQGYRSGTSRAMRRMSDEPEVPDAVNPYRGRRAESGE